MSSTQLPPNVSTGELLRLLYDTAAVAEVGDLAGLLNREQIREIHDALLRRGEPLSEGDKAALERGEADEVRALLARLRKKILRRAQPQDGITHAALRARPREGAAQPPPQEPPSTSRGAPETPSTAPAAPAAAATANAARLELLLLAQRAAPDPPGERAAATPLMQFFPPALHPAARALGVHTLADLLTRGRHPRGRELLAEGLALPRPALLLALWRAELLDLPLAQRPPHVKDVLVLARLGWLSVRHLALIHRQVSAHPTRLALLAALLQTLQRSCPQHVGRERLTEVDLKRWLAAAARRGSRLQLPDSTACWPGGHGKPTEVAAEQVLHWVTLQNSGEESSDGETLWHASVARLLMLLHSGGQSLSESLWHQLAVECTAEGLAALRETWARQADDEQRARRQERHRRFQHLAAADTPGAAHLLSELAPLWAPDPERRDGLICFWVDPVADPQHLVSHDAGLSHALRALYVCLDPATGAIAPFGG